MDKITELSSEILEHSLKDLSAEFSYLAYPLGMLDYKVAEIETKAYTNGKSAYLNQLEIVKVMAEKGVKGVSVFILHTLMHCLFLHPFKQVESEGVYDLAVDITVGYLLDGLGYFYGERSDKEARKLTYKAIIDLFGGINDGFCIEYCKALKKEKVEECKKVFTVCNHDFWYNRKSKEEQGESSCEVNISFSDAQEEVENLSSA